MDSTKPGQDHGRREDGEYHSKSDTYPTHPPNQLKKLLKQFNNIDGFNSHQNNKMYKT